jgi:hypothetical protein
VGATAVRDRLPPARPRLSALPTDRARLVVRIGRELAEDILGLVGGRRRVGATLHGASR